MKTEQETETDTPPPTNEETAAVEESRRVRPKRLVPLVAGLCALALVVAGGIGWKDLVGPPTGRGEGRVRHGLRTRRAAR